VFEVDLVRHVAESENAIMVGEDVRAGQGPTQQIDKFVSRQRSAQLEARRRGAANRFSDKHALVVGAQSPETPRGVAQMMEDPPQDRELARRHVVLQIQDLGLDAFRPRPPDQRRVDVEPSQRDRLEDLAQEDRQFAIAAPEVVHPARAEVRRQEPAQAVELPQDVGADHDVVSEHRMEEPLSSQ